MSTTYREIKSTGTSLSRCLDLVDRQGEGFQKLLKAANHIIYIGCGSSYSLTKSMANITRMHLGKEAAGLAGGDLLLHAERYKAYAEGSLIVAISRSGSTSEIVMAINRLKEMDCHFSLASISCVEDSPLSGISDTVLELPWAFDESICQTRTVSCLYGTSAYLLALTAKDKDMVSSLCKTSEGIDSFREQVEPMIKRLAAKDWNHAVVLADAEIEGAAEEAALTYKEICQLNSNYYHLLDARHGPIVMFGKKTMVAAALCSPESQLERDFLKDVVGKGSYVITCSDFPVKEDETFNVSFGKKLHNVARAIPLLMVNQLMSYYKASETGAQPDKPDGLDAWIKL